MAQQPVIMLDNRELTIVHFQRVDGQSWPFTVRMTLRFGTDKYNLSTQQVHHLLWLAAVCQQEDRIIETYGIADRKGKAAYNLALSKRRLTTVLDRLRGFGVPNDKFDGKLTRALGENFPESFGKQDEVRDSQDRAVVIFAWVNVQDFIGIGSSLAVCKFGRSGGGIPVL
ncbi:MAG TPA: OmpA family protein [Blastocatellia bacterium]|nr:OmpA family protein [Blastocatellia bacterium]